VREGGSLWVYLESVSCVPYVISQGCGVHVGERKRHSKFLEEKCRESVWPGYGEPKLELGVVNVFC